jgi:transcriptional regulator of arginine metabolism
MQKMPKNELKKASIIGALQTLLRNKSVGTQEEIRLALQNLGFVVNQVHVSRLLHKIGAIKMTEGEKVVYRLPTELISHSPKDTLKQLILNMSHNEAIIVIQTSPGAAQLVARLLDLGKETGILGTIAGDDTIFIAPKKIKEINIVFKNLTQFLLN